MFTNKRRPSVQVRRSFGLLVSAAMLVVAIGAVTSASALPGIGTVTVDTQSGTLTSGTGGSATYVVTVANDDGSAMTADLSVSWPSGSRPA